MHFPDLVSAATVRNRNTASNKRSENPGSYEHLGVHNSTVIITARKQLKFASMTHGQTKAIHTHDGTLFSQKDEGHT